MTRNMKRNAEINQEVDAWVNEGNKMLLVRLANQQEQTRSEIIQTMASILAREEADVREYGEPGWVSGRAKRAAGILRSTARRGYAD